MIRRLRRSCGFGNEKGEAEGFGGGRAGVERIILNGSFTTDIMEPNDVDCVLLTERDVPLDEAAEAELRAGLPFLDLAIVRRKDFDALVEVVFASDRHEVQKGMVEVVL